MDNGNRRKETRFPLGIPARISPASGPLKSVTLLLWSKDISSGGAYFETETPLPAGTTVTLNLMLPPREIDLDRYHCGQVEVTGRVLRRSGNGMAVCFADDYRFSSVALAAG